jgi:hypothetical protein
MSNPMLLKSFIAEAAISAYRQVKFGTVDGKVTTAAAATDMVIGVSNDVAPALGERCDIITVGIAYIEAGAAITRGALVTSDATGRAVTPAPSAGTNNRYTGIAYEAAAAAGDIIPVLLCPGMMQG